MLFYEQIMLLKLLYMNIPICGSYLLYRQKLLNYPLPTTIDIHGHTWKAAVSRFANDDNLACRL